MIKLKNMNIKKEEISNRMDRVIGWINNCDQKASILIAFIGIVFPLLFSSEFMDNIYEKLITPIVLYQKKSIGEFSFINTLAIVLLLLTISLISFSLYLLLKSLTATLSVKELNLYNNKKKKKIKSTLFFGDISDYNDFTDFKHKIYKQSKRSMIDDYISQLHINAKICSKKFEYYNNALKWLKRGLLSFLVTFFLLIYIKNI